jgi:urea transport system permease protein
MYRALQTLFVALFLSLTCLASQALADDLKAMINALGDGSFSKLGKQVEAIAATGDPQAVAALQALGDGNLYVREADQQVFITKETDDGISLSDPISGAAAGVVDESELKKIKVNNSVRGKIRSALGTLTLMSPDKATRLAAAATILANPEGQSLEVIDKAIAAEQSKDVKLAFSKARAAVVLMSDGTPEDKRAAIETIRAIGGEESLSLLATVQQTADDSIKPDIAKAIKSLQTTAELWSGAQNIWYGISLGSVLLLAAIGLAITFGVMGIINMAHGEMVMLGAYTTFVVQQVIRNDYPELFEVSLAIALPLAFIVTAIVGLVIERLVIKYLYGRPLETLLATWGISLILQQAVRSIFGPTNQEVSNPSWMSGSFALGGLAITWNRMWIVVFSLSVFFALLFTLKRTPIGLQMRAVTQNRRMASSMGIRTPWVDAATFALGSGIAGMAGVALSQIDNVSPNLGQGYIIDSFMVVVFGGVGNLWGTLVGAFSLGILNKFLEPYAGAVLGKIAVLVLIILFIQKRPRGLFALKGRSVEA